MVKRFENVAAYSFLGPFLLIYILFTVYPVFQALWMSAFDWDLLSASREFLGFQNYREMFLGDPSFWRTLGNTVVFVLLSSPLIIGVGLLLALGLSGPRGGWLRTVFFSPYVLSVAVTTLLWGFMLNPQQGLIGAALQAVGLPPLAWLTNPDLAMHGIVITTLWWTVGFNMVLFIAGLQDIDGFLYEAATIDGAGSVRKFFSITLPGLKHTLTTVAILQIIASFQIFGQVYIMTRGGPGGATRVLIQYIYETGFRDFRLGYASAMSVVLFLVMFGVSMVQLRISRRGENE
jgi:multiple sugar transport system permease protein